MEITLLHSHPGQELLYDFLEAVFVEYREFAMLLATLCNIYILFRILVQLSTALCVVVLYFHDEKFIPNHSSAIELKENVELECGLIW